MEGWLRALSKLMDNISRHLLILFFVLAFLAVIYSVFSRYVLQSTFLTTTFPAVNFSIFNLPWIEEATRYLFVWIVFLGIGIVYKSKGHAQVQLLTSYVKGKGKKALAILVEIVNSSFFVLLLIKAYEMLRITSGQLSPSLQINMAWMYAAILACATICLVHSLQFLLAELRTMGQPRLVPVRTQETGQQSEETAEVVRQSASG